MGGAAAAGWMDSCPVIPVTTRVCDGSAANHCMLLTQSASLTTPTCHHSPPHCTQDGAPTRGKDPSRAAEMGGDPGRGEWRALKAEQGVSARACDGSHPFVGARRDAARSHAQRRAAELGPTGAPILREGDLGSNLRAADWEADCKLRGRGGGVWRQGAAQLRGLVTGQHAKVSRVSDRGDIDEFLQQRSPV